MIARRLIGSALSLVSGLFLLAGLAGILSAQVRPRITRPPDDSVVVRLPGHTHAAVGVATLLGRAPANQPMERVLMQLRSSPEQAAALEQLLAEQQDPTSPRYHAWLTPEEFGARFGPAQEDIDRIVGWLQSRGFQVTEVAGGRRAIEFSGTAAQVESAFHTEINHYLWNGVRHTANGSDISIPEALAPVVAGVASLHDFGARPLHHVVRAISPEANFAGGVRGLAPYDFATIYNVSSLWNAGFDGAGQSIAIVGQTDIKLSDIAGFRATFALPANVPQVIVNGKDPGIVSGDETEADLDVEWAGAVAKGATIKFVTSASTSASDGVTLSAQYIVSHAVAPVMSVSYGLCEALMGSGNTFYGSLWQQAATEGIAVFVAAGDTGSAGCDVAYSSSGGKNATTPARSGFGVSGLASSQYNVAVGGTEFNDTASPSTYWSASNNSQMASALGYIPEVAWNESSYTTAGAAGNSLYAGGGGASGVWPRASWQTGPGVPSGTARLVPDVSLTAAGHDGYVMEQEGALYLVGGTSASTPSFAGLMAIVNQYTGTSNGNPNARLYALAAQTPSIFHDVTAGGNAVPCAGGSPNCSAAAPGANVGKMNGYSAGQGYDLATGLGSVNAYLLATNFGGAAASGPSIASLSPNPMTGSAASQSLTVNGTGFVAGSGLKVTVGGTAYVPSQVSATQLVVSVNVGTGAQSLAVQVTNPNGQTSAAASLTVNAPVVTPAITALSPNPMTASNSGQILTIKGSGFLAGLKLLIGSTTIQASQLASLSATQLTVNIVTGLTTYSYPVQVVNANGGVSNTVSLQVNAPPAITSLAPNPLSGQAAAQSLTINGGNFQTGTGLKVTVGGTAYTGSQITAASATQLKVTVTIPAGAKTLAVQVTDPDGLVSNAASLTVH
jgi:subtilase family serine protease